MMQVDPGEVITFYSHKGGTGRSMALCNIACLLAELQSNNKNEKGVLIIDWDLEAPGLHRFFQRKIKDGSSIMGEEKLDERPGVIDIFYELNKDLSNINEENINRKLDKIFESDNFILETNLPSLYMLKAGRFNKEYPSRVSHFKWESFHREKPWLIKSFAEYLSVKYKYVLIDSRAGICEISGITTVLMPDKLVAVFTPNRQSIAGIIDLVREAVSYRKQSNDLRPLLVFPLPSRIDPYEPELHKKWRNEYQSKFEKVFKEIYKINTCNMNDYFDEVQIQHVPRYAYGEEIAVLVERRRSDRLSLTKSYKTFMQVITDPRPPWDFPNSPGKLYVESSNLDEAYALIMQLAQSARESYYSTCIHPPSFWITGSYLFTWDNIEDEAKERLANMFKNKIKDPILRRKLTYDKLEYNRPRKDIINFCLSENKIFSIKLIDDHHAIAKFNRSDAVELIAKNSNDKVTKIYSGNYKDMKNYQGYFKLVNDLNIDKKKKIRLVLADITEGWDSDRDLFNKFINEYNANVTLKVGALADSEIRKRYFGDIIIIDKKIALIGDARGRFSIVTGDIIKKYLDLFETNAIEWQTPDEYWRMKFINPNRNV